MDSEIAKRIKIKKGLMKVFYGISWVFLIVSFLLIIRTQIFPKVFSSDEVSFPHFLSFFLRFIESESIKNTAMTVGLTGVLFTWLLQVIENEECSQPVSNLFRDVFKGYTWQVLIFIISLLLCIGFASPEAQNKTLWDLLIAGTTIIPVIMGIINMWILCSIFLFSHRQRREVAFSYLKKLFEDKKGNEVAILNSWQKEIPQCMYNNEKIYVEKFFELLCKGKDEIEETKVTSWYYLRYNLIRNIVLSTTPILRAELPEFIQSIQNVDEKACCLSIYLNVLSELYSEEATGNTIWKANKYTFLFHYFLESSILKNTSTDEMFYIFCAFVACEKIKDEKVLSEIEEIDSSFIIYKYWNTPSSSENITRYFEKMQETISYLNDVKKDSSLSYWASAEQLYIRLCELKSQHPGEASVSSTTDLTEKKEPDTKAMYTDLRVIDMYRQSKTIDLFSLKGGADWLALGHFSQLSIKKLNNSDSKVVDLSLIFTHNQKLSKGKDNMGTYNQPVYILQEFNLEDKTKIEEFWDKSTAFLLVTRVHSAGNAQSTFEEEINGCLCNEVACESIHPMQHSALSLKVEQQDNDINFLLYRTLEFSDVILVAKSNSIEKLLLALGRLFYLPCVGDIYSYFGIAPTEFSQSSSLSSSEDKIPYVMMRFAVKDANKSRKFLNTFTNNLPEEIKEKIEPPLFITGIEDLMLIARDLNSHQICTVLYELLPKAAANPAADSSPVPAFWDSFDDMTTRLSINESSLIERNETGNRFPSDLFGVYNHLYARFHIIYQKYEMQKYPDWLRPAEELIKSMRQISGNCTLNQVCYTVLGGIRAIVRLAERIYSNPTNTVPLTEMLQKALTGVSTLMEHMIRMEGELVHHPETRPLLYDIPANLLELYLYFSDMCLTYFNSRESDNENAIVKHFQILIVPCLCENIAIRSIDKDPDEIVLLYIEIPLHLLYDSKFAICTLVHEVAHFSGEKTRERDRRFNSLSMGVASQLMIPLGISGKEILKTVKSRIEELVPQEKRNYISDIMPALTDAANEILNDSEFKKNLLHDSQHNYDFNTMEKARLSLPEVINELIDLHREAYADLAMVSLLHLPFDYYINMIAQDLHSSDKGMFANAVERAAVVVLACGGSLDAKGEFAEKVKKCIAWLQSDRSEQLDDEYHNFEAVASVLLYLKDCHKKICSLDSETKNKKTLNKIQEQFIAFAENQEFASPKFYEALEEHRKRLLNEKT